MIHYQAMFPPLYNVLAEFRLPLYNADPPITRILVLNFFLPKTALLGGGLTVYPVSDYIQFFEGSDFLPDHFLAEYFKKFILYLALNEHVELNNCKVKSHLQYEITFTA